MTAVVMDALGHLSAVGCWKNWKQMHTFLIIGLYCLKGRVLRQVANKLPNNIHNALLMGLRHIFTVSFKNHFIWIYICPITWSGYSLKKLHCLNGKKKQQKIGYTESCKTEKMRTNRKFFWSAYTCFYLVRVSSSLISTMIQCEWWNNSQKLKNA